MALAPGEAGSPPETIAVYISQMLAELAEMAAFSGRKRLAGQLRIAAAQARETEDDDDRMGD